MDLTSCNSCGLVYDMNKIKFPEIWCGSELTKKAEWSEEQNCFVSTVLCVCGARIEKKGGW